MSGALQLTETEQASGNLDREDKDLCELAVVTDSEDDGQEDLSVKKMFIRRSSPQVIINRNGSRHIAPIDIVRSKVGRAEIQRQQSNTAKEEKPAHDPNSNRKES